MAASLVPVGVSNRYQWKPKAPVEKSGVLRRGHWSRLRGTGWETGSFGPSQPVLKACFLVVKTSVDSNVTRTVGAALPRPNWMGRYISSHGLCFGAVQ